MGAKAYVKYVMPDDYKGSYPLRGYMFDYTSSTDIREISWTMKGYAYTTAAAIPEDITDIIEMWEEPRPRVTLELPAPLDKLENNLIYSLTITLNIIENGETVYEKINPKGETYFATKEDAEEWIDAMRDSRK